MLEEECRKVTDRASELSSAQEAARDAVSVKETETQQLQSVLDQERAAYAEKHGCEFDNLSVDGESEVNGELNDGEYVDVCEADKHHEKPTAVQSDNMGYETMKAKLEAAEQEVLRQGKELEIFKLANVDKGDTNADVSIHSLNGTQTQTDVDLLQTLIQKLKDQIELMEPMWYIGFYTRVRKFEVERYSQADRNLLWLGLQAFKAANSKADATMYLDGCPAKRSIGSGEFLAAYQTTPNIVWEHRNFKFFQNMLSWKADMLLRYKKFYSSAKFDENFEKVFKAILPAFTISKDSDIQADPELLSAYLSLKHEHEAADKAEKNGGGRAPRISPQTSKPDAPKF